MLRVNDALGRRLSGQVFKKHASIVVFRHDQLSISVAQTLPEDVVDEVFGWLHDQRSLRYCTTVCRSWYSPSTRALFRAVTMVERPRSMWKRNKPALRLFDAHLRASPWATTVLRKLTITGPIDFSLLQEMITRLKALRSLSLVDASFLPLANWHEDFDIRPITDIQNVVIRNAQALDRIDPMTPHVLDALGWFKNIDTLDLQGQIWDAHNLLNTSAPAIRVPNMVLYHFDRSFALYELFLALGRIVLADSVKSVVVHAMRPGRAAFFNLWLSTFGQGLSDCSLRFNLLPSDAAYYAQYAPDIPALGAVSRSKIFDFTKAPQLNRVSLRFDMKFDGVPSERMLVLANTWKFCIASLSVSPSIKVVEIQFKVAARSANDVWTLMRSIHWPSLDKLVYGRPRPPMIKIGFYWDDFLPSEVPRYARFIETRVSEDTRTRMLFLPVQKRSS